MQTSKLMSEYNKKLFAKLFPDNEPIECNSVLDPNDEFYNMSFQEIAHEHLKNILDEQQFDLEFDQIKQNLNIK
jgi:hypothetical protein